MMSIGSRSSISLGIRHVSLEYLPYECKLMNENLVLLGIELGKNDDAHGEIIED